MNKLPRIQIKRSELKPGEVLCDYCTAKCCRYFSLAIDRPESFADFEYLRWYVQHEHTTIFTEDDDWFVLVHTVCEHLRPDNRCGIYETRPKIFETSEQVAEYANARFSDATTFRSPKPSGLPIID